MATTQDVGILMTLATNGVVFLICFFLFCILRYHFPKIYHARANIGLPTPEWKPGLFAWILPTLRYSENLMLRTHGLESVMYLRWVKTMLWTAVGYLVLSAAIIVPVNFTGENHKKPSNSSVFVTGIAITSMANIGTGKQATRLLWAHMALVYVFSIFLMWLLYREWRRFVFYRCRARATVSVTNRSILTWDVPHAPADPEKNPLYVPANSSSDGNAAIDIEAGWLYAADQEVKRYFERFYGADTVQYAASIWHAPTVRRQLIKYNASQRAVEAAEATFEKTGDRPLIYGLGPLGSLLGKLGCREGQDAIEYHVIERERHAGKVRARRSAGTEVKLAPAAIVTFVSPLHAAQAAQCAHNSRRWHTAPAPDPRDIAWEYFNTPYWQRVLRAFIVLSFIFLLIFFWSIPVMFASGLANLENLAKMTAFKWLRPILDINKTVTGLLSAQLPVLVIVIFWALLLLIIRTAQRQRHFFTWSRLDRAVRDSHFYFLLFNVLLLTVGGSVFANLSSFIKGLSFSFVVTLLANALPKQGYFFTNYIITKALGGFPMELLRPAALIVYYVKKFLLVKTRRDQKELDKPPPFAYASSYSTVGILGILCIIYSVMFPLIEVCGAFAFAAYYLITRYNHLYVFSSDYESSGLLWPGGFTILIVGLYIYQLVMFGVFMTYKFFAAPALFPLILLTCVFHFQSWNHFKRQWQYGSLDEVVSQMNAATGKEDFAPLRPSTGSDYVVDLEMIALDATTNSQNMNSKTPGNTSTPLPSDAYVQPDRKRIPMPADVIDMGHVE